MSLTNKFAQSLAAVDPGIQPANKSAGRGLKKRRDNRMDERRQTGNEKTAGKAQCKSGMLQITLVNTRRMVFKVP
jgi:hypothetical protein